MATSTHRDRAVLTGRRAANAMAGYVRKHAFVPRYRTEHRLPLVTDDGVRLVAARLPGPPDAMATVVLVHGFSQSSRMPRIYAFAHVLAERAHVIVPDLRGHGASSGFSSMGTYEPLDVKAAVDAAEPGLPVVTIGISLGGAAVLLHAGTYGGVAGVVAISAPAWWGAWDTPATKRIERYAMSPAGRRFLALFLRTRIAQVCEGVPHAEQQVANIAPAFTLVVADPADHYFSEDHPRTIYRWAQEPKELWMLPGTGHGTDLLTPAFTGRLLDELARRLRRPGTGPSPKR
ncbi:MAG TPA: alpha/beta fold hydrolase [Acidimicrobiales bacterium]|jgi:pimeloyl-ACP methyl ester carboxylesterase|nr:alpha/beta fold hydrolase [Acidimicrobiales bacterium]